MLTYLKILEILNIYLKNVRNTEYFNKTHAKARIGNTQTTVFSIDSSSTILYEVSDAVSVKWSRWVIKRR